MSLSQSLSGPLAEAWPEARSARPAMTRAAQGNDVEERLRLVLAAQKGDESALHTLITLYQRRIAGFVYSIVGRTDSIEDLCQTIFIKMVRSVDKLGQPEQFEAWLFRLAKNTCIDHVRRRKWTSLFTAFVPEEHDTAADSPSEVGLESLDALNHALAKLRPADRALIALAQTDLSQEEMAASLGISLVALKARLHRAREQLKKHYRHGTH